MLALNWLFNTRFFTIADQPLAANTRYTVQVDVGRPLAGNSLYDGSNEIPLIPADYRIELRVDGGLIAEDDNSLATPLGGFVTSTLTFDIPEGDPRIGKSLAVYLSAKRGDQNYDTYAAALFDNVRIDAAPIPEPTTMTLGGLAAAALLGIAISARRNTQRGPA